MRLIKQQKIWMPTLQGWLGILLFFSSLMLFFVTHIHPFLAPVSPLKADILVVEGWAEDHVVKKAYPEFEKGGYQKLITTGLPLPRGYYLSEYKNFADLAAATLIKLGFDQDKLISIPAPDVIINRTSSSAMAVREWLRKSNLQVKSMNIYSLDVHSRRSWLIYQKVFEPDIKVGIIASEPIEYNPKVWWTSSSGVRAVIAEAIAYIYARFFDWKT
jgi:hypothetical protein